MINVAVLGYGVVGSGVVEVVKTNRESIAIRAGEQIRVKRVLDIRDFPDSPDRELLTKDQEQVFGDSEINIVVETIGGIGIAYEFTKRALKSGKHVVTSNKELVATHGPELMKLAAENGVNYLFEASVGGGIPIIRPLNQCLAANEIIGITGILNGTTNYILTQMRKKGKDFETALKGAQQNGYAEANPTADIEGHDACRKIAILSSIAYNQFVDYKKIYTEGITKITLEDMQYAEKMDSVIKLIAISRRVGDKVFARVSPAMVKKSHPLANVEDVFNAIVVKGNAIGDAMFYGRGAGKLPTASAVVADIIDIVKHMDSGVTYVWERKDQDNTVDINESEIRLLVRASVNSADQARKSIEAIFGKVEYVVMDKAEFAGELAFITAETAERELAGELEELAADEAVKGILSTIRIEAE